MDWLRLLHVLMAVVVRLWALAVLLALCAFFYHYGGTWLDRVAQWFPLDY